MCRTSTEVASLEHTRQLLCAFLLSEWAVLALLFFLRAAHNGLPFFTNYPDPRLMARRHERPGERGVLFRLPPGSRRPDPCYCRWRHHRGYSVRPRGRRNLLHFMQDLDRTLPERLNTPFVWYSCNHRCALRMPLANGEEAEDEDAVLPRTTATETRTNSKSHRGGFGWVAVSPGSDIDVAPAHAPVAPGSPTL